MGDEASAPAWAGLISLGTPRLVTVPSVETVILTVPEWRPNVLVKGVCAKFSLGESTNNPVTNSLIRAYARGKQGMRVEVGRGRFNALAQYRGSLSNLNLSFAQALVAARMPAGGSSIEVTWVGDNVTATSNECIAQFEVDAWGVDGGSPTDDSIPSPAVAQQFFAQTSSVQVAPTALAANVEPHDSYLIEALFANQSGSDAYVYFVDVVNHPTYVQRTPAIRVPAGQTASYTPRRPVHFLVSMQMLVSNSNEGPNAGESALVDATLTWV